jgi:hypothetical protein
VRLVALSSIDGQLGWQTDDRAPDVVRRYRDTFADSSPVRFPADTDQFSLTGAGRGVAVKEVQSGAQWSLQLQPGGATDR